MRIGLIGWYGKKNAGDERILYCLKRFFAEDELVVTTAWEDAWQKRDLLNACDYVFIGGGGLILRGVNAWTKLLTALEPPVGCVGISIETWHADAAAFLDTLKDRCEFILVRDVQSAEILNHPSKVITGPDLTFLYPFDIAPSSRTEILGLNLRPWHYWPGELYSSTYYWMSQLNQRFPQFKKWYPFKKWDPDWLVGQLQSCFDAIVPISLNHHGNDNDATLLARYFSEAIPDFNPDTLAACQYFVGMRLHSLIFACQMGIPFLSLSYLPKNEQFCQSLGLAHLSLSIYDRRNLSTAVMTLRQAAQDIRATLLEARQRNMAAITQLMTQIRAAMNSTFERA